jgi:hypothetical protein
VRVVMMKTEILSAVQRHITPVSFMKHACEVLCRSLGGGIDLIWVSQGDRQGLISPFYDAYFNRNALDIVAMTEQNRLEETTGIITCVPRRKSKAENFAIKEMQHDICRDSRLLEEQSYFVRLSTNDSDEETKLYKACQEVAEV